MSSSTSNSATCSSSCSIKPCLTKPINLFTIVLPILLLTSYGILFLIERVALKTASSLHFRRFTFVAYAAALLIVLRLLGMVACRKKSDTPASSSLPTTPLTPPSKAASDVPFPPLFYTHPDSLEQPNHKTHSRTPTPLFVEKEEHSSSDESTNEEFPLQPSPTKTTPPSLPPEPSPPPPPLQRSPYGHRLPGQLSLKEATEHMWRNLHRAHAAIPSSAEKDYLPSEMLPPVEAFLQPAPVPQPLSFTKHVATHLGLREEQEDRHLFLTNESNQGFVAGIFDGHGGNKFSRGDIVSQYVAEQCTKRYFPKLLENGGFVHKTMEELLPELHAEVCENDKWKCQGTTALLCDFDPKTNILTTATLGDSEAMLYRKIGGKWKVIPLSVVRNWNSKKDEARALQILYDNSDDSLMPRDEMFEAQKKLFLRGKGKKRYYPFNLPEVIRINVSRSIGDAQHAPAVIQKGKNVEMIVQEGDLLIMGSDGFWDFACKEHNQEQIISLLERKPKDPALALTELAYASMNIEYKDNITVMFLEFGIQE